MNLRIIIKPAFVIGSIIALGLSLQGCGRKNLNPKPMPTSASVRAEMDMLEVGATKILPVVEYEMGELKHIRFDFDEYVTKENEFPQIFSNSEEITKSPMAYIVISGHADERGSEVYNKALGLLRAVFVGQAYVELGVPPAAISIESAGETEPLCAEKTEECFARNRRVETRILILGELPRHD